jgi:translation elongation factor EF-Tu-like GTPase
MSWRTVTTQLDLLPTSAGGRSTAVLSGYRSLLRFVESTTDFGFELELDTITNPNGIAPGSSGSGRISFWAAEQLPHLFQGQRFEIREGQRVVGHGFIVDPG